MAGKNMSKLPTTQRPATVLFCAKGGVCGAMLALAGCVRGTLEPLPLPQDIAQFVPTDIDKQEINQDPEGCYFYVYASELILIRDHSGDPVCLNPQ